jgi:hypothetical protein
MFHVLLNNRTRPVTNNFKIPVLPFTCCLNEVILVKSNVMEAQMKLRKYLVAVLGSADG